MLSASEMEDLYNATQQTALSVIIGEFGAIERREYVDTTRGVVLLTTAAIKFAISKFSELHKTKQGSETKRDSRNSTF